jgi:hypothetical protein
MKALVIGSFEKQFDGLMAIIMLGLQHIKLQ